MTDFDKGGMPAENDWPILFLLFEDKKIQTERTPV